MWVYFLSTYLAQLQKGNIYQSLHIFYHIKQYSCSKVIFDFNKALWSDNQFNKYRWTEF